MKKITILLVSLIAILSLVTACASSTRSSEAPAMDYRSLE